MTFEELLKQRRVALEPTGPDEVARLHALVQRHLADAAIEEMSPEGRFQQAYGAARTLATIVVRASGYRVRQPGAHYNTFLALEAADPEAFSAHATYFDACRTMRNELAYNDPERVSDTELDEILRLVPEFARAVEAWLQRNHPEYPTAPC
jgi:hypothetical protein